MKRITATVAVGTLVVATLLSMRWGAASSLAVGSHSLGTGTAPVTRCDTDGVRTTPSVASGNLTSVTVGDISSTCGGHLVSVTADSSGQTGSGTAVVPAGGGSVAVNLSPATPVTASVRLDVVMTGPQ